MTLDRLLTADLFSLLLVFARIGAVMMLMPGIGENFVLSRARLLLAVAVTILLTPVLAARLPPPPGNLGELAALLIGEILVGLAIGAILKTAMSTLETAGQVAALQMGLSGITLLNPLLASQGSPTGLLMTMVASVLLFATNLHHAILSALVDSYVLFRPAALPPVGDFSEVFVRMVGHSFKLGLELAAPLILFNTVLNIALGLISRLVPQIQVFLIAVPAQIMIGLVIFAGTLSTAMLLFLQDLANVITNLLGPR
jgi:flagellar biosynthesis protein FliR